MNRKIIWLSALALVVCAQILTGCVEKQGNKDIGEAEAQR